VEQVLKVLDEPLRKAAVEPVSSMKAKVIRVAEKWEEKTKVPLEDVLDA
jgi:hypothetical protein